MRKINPYDTLLAMYPVLATIGSWPISSFGFFLAVSLFLSSFIVWRISRVYDLNEERVIDLILLTFFGGLIAARLYFAFFHPNFFTSNIASDSLLDKVMRIILINRFPGLSFWGGLVGGFITLFLLCKKFKLRFWEVMDFAIVGYFLGISISSLGCFFGGCQAGLPSNWPIAFKMVGLVGRRFPIQLIEFIVFLLAFFYLWGATVRFHFVGKTATVGLIVLGILKFTFDFYRDEPHIVLGLTLGSLYSLVLILAGIIGFYVCSHRSLVYDIKSLLIICINKEKRHLVLSKLVKQWYNQKVRFMQSLDKSLKLIVRRLNIRSNPKNF